MATASGDVQRKVPEVMRRWAGEGGAACAAAGLGERVWGAGRECGELLHMQMCGRCALDLSVGSLTC